MPIEDHQNYSQYPQLLATPWSSDFIGSACNVQIKNRYDALDEPECENDASSSRIEIVDEIPKESKTNAPKENIK